MPRIKREKISRLEKKEDREYRTKSLYTSLIISISCVIMSCFCLLGTTYALFTDSAFTKGNYIKSGILKVVLFLCDDEANINPDNMIYSSDENEEYELKVNGQENVIEPGGSINQKICVRNQGNILSQYSIGFSINDPQENGDSLADALEVYYVYVNEEENANEEPSYLYLGKLNEVINGQKYIIGNLAAIQIDELSESNEEEIPMSQLIDVKLSLPKNADYDKYSDSSLSLSLTLSSSQSISNIYTFNVEHYLYETSSDAFNDYSHIEDEIISGPGAYHFGDEIVLDTLDDNGNLKTIITDGKVYKLKGFYQLVDGENSDDNYTEFNEFTDYSFNISSNVKYRLRYEFEEVVEDTEE